MKKILLLIGLQFLFILNVCQSKKTPIVDYEKEKVKIQEIMNENYRCLIKGDTAELVSFIRKYYKPGNYSTYNNYIFFINLNDSTDDAIYNEFLGPNFKYISITPSITPIIKVSADASMAYMLGKDSLRFEYDSSNIKKQNATCVTYMLIFEKQDTIWQMGDVAQNVKDY